MTTTSVSTNGATIQFSGLGSGLDTASIISSLMQVESAPQTALKNRVAAQQAQVSALQQVNTSFAALSTSAASFLTGSTWTQLAATSSNTAVTAKAASTTAPVTFDLTVTQLAASAQAVVSAPAPANTTFTIYDNSGNAVGTFGSGDGSLSAMASAINAGSTTTNLQAHVVHATGGDVLLLTSAKTGAASNFSVATADGATVLAAKTTNGTDATVDLGNGVTASSATDTFTGLMNGIDVTVAAGTALGTKATITVAADGGSRATALKAFVGQINDLLSSIASTTAYGTITAGQSASGGGALPGDSTLRGLADQLVNTIFPTGTSGLTQYGLSVDRYGQLTFDANAFTAAYNADPTGVQSAFTGPNGFAQRVKTVADNASDPYSGSLSLYIKNDNTEIGRNNDQIAAWDDRLAAKQASLQQIYDALEVQLSKLQSQQSWLTSQIESLDGLSPSGK